MQYTIWQFIFFFFLYSILGWLSEVSYAALETGELVNRGFLNGPLCPIYGSGMVAILIALGPWLDNVLVVFFGGMVITTLVEWVGGAVLYHIFHTRWWDYSNEHFNIGGYICLKFSLMWGIGSILLVMVFHPILSGVVVHIPYLPMVIIDCVCLVIFAADFGVSFAAAVGLNKRLQQLDEVRAMLRKGSDKITAVVGSNVITADEMLDEQKLQLALAKLEGRQGAEQAKAELLARRAEITAKYQQAVDSLEHSKYFGAGRLLRAFPDMKSRDYSETLAGWYARGSRLAAAAKEKAAAAKEKVTSAARK